jgi:hypothetical protein
MTSSTYCKLFKKIDKFTTILYVAIVIV